MQVPMKQVGVVLAIVLTGIFVALLAPLAMNALADANTTAWTASQIALWAIIGIVIIIAIVLVILDMVGNRK